MRRSGAEERCGGAERRSGAFFSMSHYQQSNTVQTLIMGVVALLGLVVFSLIFYGLFLLYNCFKKPVKTIGRKSVLMKDTLVKRMHTSRDNQTGVNENEIISPIQRSVSFNKAISSSKQYEQPVNLHKIKSKFSQVEALQENSIEGHVHDQKSPSFSKLHIDDQNYFYNDTYSDLQTSKFISSSENGLGMNHLSHSQFMINDFDDSKSSNSTTGQSGISFSNKRFYFQPNSSQYPLYNTLPSKGGSTTTRTARRNNSYTHQTNTIVSTKTDPLEIVVEEDDLKRSKNRHCVTAQAKSYHLIPTKENEVDQISLNQQLFNAMSPKTRSEWHQIQRIFGGKTKPVDITDGHCFGQKEIDSRSSQMDRSFKNRKYLEQQHNLAEVAMMARSVSLMKGNNGMSGLVVKPESAGKIRQSTSLGMRLLKDAENSQV